MTKTDYPVLLLKGLVLLPNNELRLEFDQNQNKGVLDVSELFHNNEILIVSQKNPLEERPEVRELPKIAVLGKIARKMELPNGKVRIIIETTERMEIHEYLNLKQDHETLEAIASSMKEVVLDSNEEETLVRKVYKEVETYIRMIPYISNSVLSLIVNVTSLSKLTDLIVPHLSISPERTQLYLHTLDPSKRAEMILEDVYKEEEMYKIEKNIDSRVREEIDSSQKEYLLREKMKKIKEELGEASLKDDEVTTLREKIEALDANETIKKRLTTELRRYENSSNMSPETNIIRNYIDWLLELPWNIYTEDNEDLRDVRKSLDASHYGLDKVKDRIIEFLAVKQMTGNLKSPIICLVGPPGVGKTSLAFSIASAMHRKFVKMSVGGVNDEAEIVGHRRTYLGANPGRIIQGIKKAGSTNPVFLIDEIDKMTKDVKGDPASALLEILDPEQNMYFSDNYIEESYDLSHIMFIATANYIEDIPLELKDRLEIVDLSGYTEYEKLDIAKRHLIPKIIKEHGLEGKKMAISDQIILKIIREYTREAGVRELERQLATIARKIVTMMVSNHIKIATINVLEKDLEKYLGKAKYHHSKKAKKAQIGVVNGLAYTQFGGDTLPIEVNFYKGSGNLALTGSLGDVMKESAQIALSYIKSNYQKFRIDYNKLIENDIHIHVPEGATPKDGPSAGIALTTALISAFTDLKISDTLAMTGEITLRGHVLPIGGLKEKSMGAHRNGIKTILIPEDNMNDLDEIPKEIRDDITYIPVKDYKDVYKHITNEDIK